MSFSHTIKQQSNIYVISLSGRLIDKNEAINLIDEVENIASDPLKLIIDLSELQYMNSSGLNVLINLLTKARKTGGDAILINEPEIIKKLLVITKLNQVFNVVENMQEATDLLQKQNQ